MGYLFLALALAAGFVKGYCGKRSSHAIGRNSDAVAITAVRMLLCCVVGVILPLVAGINPFAASSGMILVASICGICSAAFTVCWLLSVSNTMYMLVEVFVAAGVLLPLTTSYFLYGEPISELDIVGVAILLVGVYLTSTGEKKAGKWTLKSIVLLLLCTLSYGGVDIMQKVYTHEFPEENALVFNLYIYISAALSLLIINAVVCLKDKRSMLKSFGVVKPIIGYVILMAACLFLNSYFKTNAASYLDAIVLYPANQGLSMVISSLMAVFLFKEKISLKAGIGIGLTLAAIILINMF